MTDFILWCIFAALFVLSCLVAWCIVRIGDVRENVGHLHDEFDCLNNDVRSAISQESERNPSPDSRWRPLL